MVVQAIERHPQIESHTQPAQTEDIVSFLGRITDAIINDRYSVSREEALRIAHTTQDDAMLLFHHASKIRQHFKGGTVSLCSIVNAKSGACSEDCGFCSQSAHFKTEAPVYKLLDPQDVVNVAKQAKADGAESFGIVISGYGVRDEKEKQAIAKIIKAIREEVDIEVHGSFGILDQETVDFFRDCGITQINHNLESSKRYYPTVCTTHTYDERLDTLKYIRQSGIKLCSGGIFGMGETVEDRVDMALELRQLDVETAPLNFLHRIDGTPLETQTPLEPLECLVIVALFRFIMPTVELKVCGGRETNLRDFQSMIFLAGADSMMIGNYLTTAGREPKLDWQMMKDLGLKWTTMEKS